VSPIRRGRGAIGHPPVVRFAQIRSIWSRPASGWGGRSVPSRFTGNSISPWDARTRPLTQVGVSTGFIVTPKASVLAVDRREGGSNSESSANVLSTVVDSDGMDEGSDGEPGVTTSLATLMPAGNDIFANRELLNIDHVPDQNRIVGRDDHPSGGLRPTRSVRP